MNIRNQPNSDSYIFCFPIYSFDDSNNEKSEETEWVTATYVIKKERFLLVDILVDETETANFINSREGIPLRKSMMSMMLNLYTMHVEQLT